jgi:hemolysin D
MGKISDTWPMAIVGKQQRPMDFWASVRGDVKMARADTCEWLTLAVHTLGSVATAAQPLLEIVPGDTLQVKATIDNRDVGFIREGQPAVIKVAAFPHTHYGYLKGNVVELSNDAAQDKRRGSVFVAYVRLTSNKMWIDGRWVTLTPGEAVSIEITTGKRRVISYFLGPLIKSTSESLHER